MRCPSLYVGWCVCVWFWMFLYLQLIMVFRTHLNTDVLLQKTLAKIDSDLSQPSTREYSNFGKLRQRTSLKSQHGGNIDRSSHFANSTMSTISNRSLTVEYWQNVFMKDFNSALHSENKPARWQRDIKDRIEGRSTTRSTYYLTLLLMVRLYHDDLARWTIRELKQWIHYMFLIGVEHIYVCDHWHEGDDNMEDQLEKYIELGLMSYSRIFIDVAMNAQVRCYERWVDIDENRSTWMMTIDMDEFPFHLQDQQENFLKRFLENVEQKFPRVAEILMPNYLMLGQGDRTRNLTVDRIRRCIPRPVNALVKPLFKPQYVRPQIHGGIHMQETERMDSDSLGLRMLHYWGARLQKWGPDGEYTYNITIPFSDMALAWVDRIRNSLLTFGETDAFTSQSGP